MSADLPYGATGDDSPFWAGAAERRLVLQRCDDCAYVRWPAAGVCPECLSRQVTWAEVEGRGTIWSHVVYHRAYAASLREQVPYRVALVELVCGARILGRVPDVTTPLAVGDEVVVDYAEVGEHGLVPVVVPVPRSA
ncbi:OB-fold domain-containing protein [Nocardioides zeae]|uniref:OB-fold domain-containing protein n=1 Tax=Nocardioides imazamoxiresistens TaxID=3231893 RepID=A0ABU3PTM6_9ACTN|nr:OB-fold domain-containing protein [Nocardioides zeae]MDT9592155.1 OB-fold domain-containing protein [Nocardioides zeae]